MLKIYDYFRSSCAYRLRIALNLKGITQIEREFVNLRIGEQHDLNYHAVTPLGTVPTLIHDGVVIPESMAAIEYLDEVFPEPPLLPSDPAGRARVRSIAQAIACDIHPINNLRVLNYLKNEMAVTEEQKEAWYHHWVTVGFQSLEKMLASSPDSTFCHGDTVTLADICLIPQVFNAMRYDVDISPFPKISRIHARCEEIPAFAAAHPSKQPDAVK